jgi:precorrin-6A/cobalt-precorrin-6A reductase
VPDRTETILILGGTREAAAELARALVDRNSPEARIITSLAGRTREPAPLAGEVRTGGFGGIDGLVQLSRRKTRSHI